MVALTREDAHAIRSSLSVRDSSSVDQTNLPLLVSLAVFCAVAAIFIVYACVIRIVNFPYKTYEPFVRVIMRHRLGPQDRRPVILADGSIWGLGGRHRKPRRPLGPRPVISEAWVVPSKSSPVIMGWDEVKVVVIPYLFKITFKLTP
jgi:hypothetical protein